MKLVFIISILCFLTLLMNSWFYYMTGSLVNLALAIGGGIACMTAIGFWMEVK